ncbi:MAG: hypothetical protein PWQ27_1098 [Kosmotoga sp.]|nr:hypothetical protein [Kosmotoga sp.]
MKKLNIALCVLMLIMVILNGVFLYRNWNLSQVLSGMVVSNISRLESELQGLRHSVNTALGRIQLYSENNSGNRIMGTEFKLRGFDEEHVILDCRLSFSRVDKDERVYLVLHEEGSDLYQKIELTKLEGTFYTAELCLAPEKEYKYQVVFEKDGTTISSQEFKVLEHYYRPQACRVIPRFIINSTKGEKVPELEFRLDIGIKAYFEELQVKTAKVVVYEDSTKVKELSFFQNLKVSNYDFYYGSRSVSFDLDGKDIRKYDFYFLVEYKGGLIKREKMNDEKNPVWEAVLNNYVWYLKSN